LTRMLLTPGPVEVPHHVALEGATRMISHRSGQFSALYRELLADLCHLLEVEEPPVLFPGSGTGALDALCQNLLSPGDRVISLSCGAFGHRFREIALRRGVDVIPLDVPWGEGIGPDLVAQAIRANRDTRAVLITHNETSTGVLNPIELVTEVIPDDVLVLVDAVSSVGAVPCLPSKWRVDGLATSSQKGLMCPPGLGMVWLSPRGWERAAQVSCPTYSLDLKLYRLHRERAMETPYTPPVSLYFQLARALKDILSHPKETWWRDRRRFSRGLCAALEALGLSPLVKDPSLRSPGVTAIVGEEGLCKGIRKSLAQMGLQVASGQGDVKDRLVRIAHYTPMGWPELSMICGTVWKAMVEMGMRPGMDRVMEAALLEMEG